MKRNADDPVSRCWLLQGVPKRWSVEQATLAMETAFSKVELLRQNRRQGNTEFVFRGTSSTANDTVAIPFDDEDGGVSTLWARWAPPRQTNQPFRKCHTTGSWALQPRRSPFQTEAIATPVEAEAADGQQASPATNAPAADAESGKQKANIQEAPANPPSRRVRAEQRALPNGVTVHTVPGDGTCFFIR